MTTVTEHPDRRSWLEARRQGLGSSDAPKVLGIPFVPGSQPPSPFELWAEKTGKLSSDDDEEINERFLFGHLAEPMIAERASSVVDPLCVFDPGDFSIATAEDGFSQATVDRLLLPDEGQEPPTNPALADQFSVAIGPGELKTVELYAAADWDEEPSLYAQVQVQHQMYVGGWNEAWIFAQVGFSKFKWYHVERSPSFIEMLKNELGEFWRLVQADEPPPVDGTDATRRVLQLLYPEVKVEEIELHEDYRQIALELAEWKDKRKVAEMEIKVREAQVMAAMGDAERAVIPGHDKAFTWKEQTRKEYTVPAKTFRVLREVKA